MYRGRLKQPLSRRPDSMGGQLERRFLMISRKGFSLICRLILGTVACMSCPGWAANVLINPGFEDGVPSINQEAGYQVQFASWRYVCADNYSGFWNSADLAWAGGPRVRTGSASVRVFHYGGWSETPHIPPGWRYSTLSQTVDVYPDRDYSASAWVYIFLESGSTLGDQFYVGVLVEELNSAQSVIASRQSVLSGDADANQWKQIRLYFTTRPQTAKIRFTLVNNWFVKMTENHITWDDCQLESVDASDRYVDGVVRSGATPLSGATVTAGGVTAVTDIDGSYRIKCPSDTGYVTVRASRKGYHAQRKYRVLTGAFTAVDFDLVERGDNLLVNAGFDDDAYAGGWVEDTYGSALAYRRGESRFFASMVPAYYVSGEEAMGLFTSYSTVGGGVWYHQSAQVVGGAQYTARVKTRISMAAGAVSAWGNLQDNQVAGLLVKEYNALGDLVIEHPLVASNELPAWETLESVFNAQPQSTTIKIGPYVWTNEDSSANWWWPRATFDDVELRGPAGEYGLSGTVRSGSTPLADATIIVSELDGADSVCTTGADGRYIASVAWGSQYQLTVYKAGCYTQTASASITGPAVVDFDLIPVGGNLLFNAGFDDPSGWLSGGWSTSGPAAVGNETWTADYGPVFLDSPSQAVYIRGPNASGRVYQDVPVAPNTQYSASCRFRPGTDARYGSKWGIDPSQRAAIFVQELDAAGQPVGDERQVFAQVTTANRDEWHSLAMDFVTSSSTAFARVGGYAYLVDNYDSNLARAVFDTFALRGPGRPGTGLAAARGLPDGSFVRLSGKVVTAAFDGFVYIQEPDRSSGIRASGVARPGDAVDILGVMTTVDGERAIETESIILRQAVGVPGPMLMTVRDTRRGLSPVGLYVTLCGKVTDRRTGHFTLDDGSGAPIKVYGVAHIGDLVRVTGALGAELSDNALQPVLRATRTLVIDQGQFATPVNLKAGLLLDEECRIAANSVGLNYWWVYMIETLDRLGLTAAVLSTSDLTSQLADLSVLFIGAAEEARLSDAQIQMIDSWVKAGGVLVASGSSRLDSTMGNQYAHLDPSAGEFAVSCEFTLRETAFSQGIQTPLHPDSPMIAIGPVRWVRPVFSTAIADNGGDAVITARGYGKGWAFYFGFNLGQTFWVIQQGRPVDQDYDGDGYLRSGDAMVIGGREPEVPYTDQILFLLRNMIAVRPHPLVHQLPAVGDLIPDMLLFYGGDDEAGSGIQVAAAEFMHSRGLPYHINALPYNGGFGLTPAEMAYCESLGTELSIHYDFVYGYYPVGNFTKADVDYQTNLFINYFGKTPVSSVNHWTTWIGWHEPALWMMEAGLKGDNGRFCVQLTSSNPTNVIGHAFGTAFPYHFWTDHADGNRRLDFVEMPISGYELGYQGDWRDPASVYRAVYLAQYYNYTFSFFYHPVYIAVYPACRDAIDTILDLADHYGLRALHTTPDNLALWWMDRSEISIANVQFSANRLEFDSCKPSAGDYVVRIPMGGYEAVDVPYPHRVEERFGVKWLMIALQGGSTRVELNLRPAGQ